MQTTFTVTKLDPRPNKWPKIGSAPTKRRQQRVDSLALETLSKKLFGTFGREGGTGLKGMTIACRLSVVIFRVVHVSGVRF